MTSALFRFLFFLFPLNLLSLSAPFLLNVLNAGKIHRVSAFAKLVKESAPEWLVMWQDSQTNVSLHDGVKR